VDDKLKHIKQFYRDGGYVTEPERRANPLEMWAAEHMATGGQVPGYATGDKVSKLLRAVTDKVGLTQGRRLEQAADLGVDLSMFTPNALIKAANPEQGRLLTVMPPGDFQDFALRIPDHFKEQTPYQLAGHFDQAPSFQDVLDYYRHIGQKKGWSDVPELGIDVRATPIFGKGPDNEFPLVTYHEGRHRGETLADRGDRASLVSLYPSEPYGSGRTHAYNRLLPLEERAPDFQKYLSGYGNRVIGQENSIDMRAYDSAADLPVLPQTFAEGGQSRMRPLLMWAANFAGGGQVPGFAGGNKFDALLNFGKYVANGSRIGNGGRCPRSPPI